MDKQQETNLRLTMVMKLIEAGIIPTTDQIAQIQATLDWILAPTKAQIIQANALFMGSNG